MNRRYYHFAGILILIIILIRLDLSAVVRVLSDVNIVRFFLVSMLLLLILLLKSIRWRYILSSLDVCYSVKEAFFTYISGIFAGLVTPGRLGEAAKALYLKKEKAVELGKGLASVYIDRLCDLYLLLVFGVLGMYWFHKGFGGSISFIVMVVFLMGMPFIILNRRLMSLLANLVKRIPVLKRYEPRFKSQYGQFYESVKKIGIKHVVLLSIITLCSGLLYFWQCSMIIGLVGEMLPFLTVVYFVSISALIGILPISIMGIGTREAAFIYLFSLIGQDAEKALAVSLLIFVSFYLNSCILGFIAWQLKGKGMA